MLRFFRSASASTSSAPSSEAKTSPRPFAHRVPTVGRRWLAWSLEAAILAASIGVPLALGGSVNQRSAEEPQPPLSPALRVAQTHTARLLGLPQRLLPQSAPPLTQVLWSGAVGLPLILIGAHLYGISRRGSSGPKRWLGLQIVALDGQVPGWRRILLREGLGRWGGPLLVAYGLWRVSGGFPSLLIFSGLGALILVGESLTGLGNRPRRSWHDWLAGTCIVDCETGAMVRLAARWRETKDLGDLGSPDLSGALIWTEHTGGLTSRVMSPRRENWQERPRLPLAWILIGGCLVGISGYSLWQNHSARSAHQTLFTDLVTTLTSPESNGESRRAAVLALGTVADHRVTPLLVDLIAQAEDPLWLDTLQQAVVHRGPAALPALKRLNQSLSRDLTVQSDPALRRSLAIRLRAVNRILAQLIALAGDRAPEFDLSGLNLGYLVADQGNFALTLPQQALAGMRWRGTVMNRAQLQGAKFFAPGPDHHTDTYDDWIADLSGADLTDADLSGADLTLVQLSGASLLRAKLPQAQLTLANLKGVNLERANLIQAHLERATLTQARLIAADLTTAQLPQAKLREARMRQVIADGANFSEADLQAIEAQDARLIAANLSHANLQGADLTGASLVGANLQGANLQAASLQGADLREVQLRGANLAGTNLAGAILSHESPIVTDGFVTPVPDLKQGDRFAGVDFNVARNIDAAQLAHICAQGGIHNACESPSPLGGVP
ncbi:pentapeptide repeat-containing protein [Leptolyngbya sp. PCC 6406]|uniref:pentapeptide repeat-containing protein n=1 Tax=Leptolyngbya sp. PCC 6406 TaxID=1173264 RepID=UPI00048250CD|nr:pentapeptide repeat-containing protein [Leptolyngbya sp. PCC 6406]